MGKIKASLVDGRSKWTGDIDRRPLEKQNLRVCEHSCSMHVRAYMHADLRI